MNVISRQIGDFVVTPLSDGSMAASLELLSGISTTEAGEIQRQAGVAEPGDLHIYGYLIRGRGRTILVDSGTGGVNNVGGQLKANLQGEGIEAEAVDTVLLTHAHPDHVGGLLDEEGLTVYPNAELYLHPLEKAFWLDDARFAQANERQRRNFIRARQTLAAYGERVHLLSDAPIAEGILPVPLPGHTPGHTGFRIDAPEANLIIWGDIVHFPYIQTAHPGVSIAFDIDREQAEESRKRILAQAAAEKWLVAGMHFGGSGFARVIPETQGYRIVYEEA